MVEPDCSTHTNYNSWYTNAGQICQCSINNVFNNTEFYRKKAFGPHKSYLRSLIFNNDKYIFDLWILHCYKSA